MITPNRETMVLSPGEQLIYEKQSQKWTKHKVDVYEKVAWKDGKLIFRNASLEEIFKRLSRHFNVEILFNNRSGKNIDTGLLSGAKLCRRYWIIWQNRQH